MSHSTTSSATEEQGFKDLCAQLLVAAKEEHGVSQSDKDVTKRAKALWDWAGKIDPNEAKIRLRAEGKGFVLEAIGPDRPFLVDSLLNTCSEFGIQVLALFHPIVGHDKATRRSFIQIVLPPLTDIEQENLAREAEATVRDVIMATSDYDGMKQRMSAALTRVQASPHIEFDQKAEAIAFLDWLEHDRFVFLGVRDYRFHTSEDGTVLPEEPDMVEGSNLGLLRDENRNVLNRGAEPLVLSPEIGAFLSEPEPLILAKATLVSRVHRRVVCDYIGVKHFDDEGRVIGETRFLGLYTAEAYDDSVRNIPLIRKRANRVMFSSGALKGTYNEKTLSNILESWPRDELFQTQSEELIPIMKGVLSLVGRPRVKLFVRPDRFKRFVVAIVFVPREAYDTELRQRITELLEDAYQGRLVQFQPRFDATSMVRVMFEIALPHDAPTPDIEALEANIVEIARSWDDRFRAAVLSADLDKQTCAIAARFAGAFNAAYREAFTPVEAMTDVSAMSAINAENPVRLRAYRLADDADTIVRAKIYSRAGSIALSDCVPIFERMGMFVEFETGYPVRPSERPVADAPSTYWVHSLSMHHADGRSLNLEEIGSVFEQAFVAVWSEKSENDGFNALVFNAGLTWREAALCRTLCAYRHQTGLDPARATQIEALNAHPDIACALTELFAVRFDPELFSDLSARTVAADAKTKGIVDALKAVSSLDHDRVLRRLLRLIQATKRTNYYQIDRRTKAPYPYIALKIASRELTELPAPKPYREIFMSGPEVEGVHCRFGAVARGGLRWSDRRDDFRTEVLGLVKAQQVKNAVIVPVGSKGGFYPKQLPVSSDRDAFREAGISAYKTFISALLNLTDNLIDGAVQPPENTVIWDGEDPYLVVAADKGTATFSDIANQISIEQGFWLGDAFASGGSAGYDHKKMGITARGGWEAVKRHFREMGKDIQTEPFTVIGCGDMSGDVFGNGMLLSKQIRLQAAFNHLHIFIDPDPQDPERLWQERKRIFDLPRSSWGDYDESLISKGGGLFERSAKSIELTPQIQKLTGLTEKEVTPDELIHALLKSPCELLWFGGIGTYIKATHETHADAGDHGNNAVRVNASEVGAKVIGEGANLGLTQAGRIEFAQHGGCINTDAIDNSAGVDSSDHEVNIKILCTAAMRAGTLPSGERNTLLASMTDDVAHNVLRHNYAQTGALSLAEASAARDHDALERLMVRLEKRGVLDRVVEGLPDTNEMAERRQAKKTLTRPELAILMAWTKIVLFDDLIASPLPDDPHFASTLRDYFPKALHKFDEAMGEHRLKREIIATVIANRVVDLAGPVHFLRLREQSEARSSQLVTAIETAHHLIEADQVQAEINALDNKVSADQQMILQSALADAIGELALSLVNTHRDLPIGARIEKFKPHFKAMAKAVPDALMPFERARFDERVELLMCFDVPETLAHRIAVAELLPQLPLLETLIEPKKSSAGKVFTAYQVIGEGLAIDRLKASAKDSLPNMPYWDRLATRKLVQDMVQQQAEATRLALQNGGPQKWLSTQDDICRDLTDNIDLLTTANATFAQFALAGDAVREFMRAASGAYQA